MLPEGAEFGIFRHQSVVVSSEVPHRSTPM